MNAKSTISTGPDRDDPPRFTREMAERGRHLVGDRVVREARPQGRPRKPDGERKEKVTLRLSPQVLSHFRGTGAGWQSRLDDVLLDHARLAAAASEAGVAGARGANIARGAEAAKAEIVSLDVSVTERGGRRRRILLIDPKTGHLEPVQEPARSETKRKAG